ncbi:hypothetical protein Egran_06757 [Elaphomyces granulatus]|uniref:Uncharacterized protein n=1 Tax=Elaphomyces granulatus TaxID=519963 RepID=A0A232LMU9_9EURO|nr:hypothetical protein Egran_06757 [Elaphomyces granulatus]
MKYLFGREAVKNGYINVKHVASVENVADGLTKALDEEKFKHFVELLGLGLDTTENKGDTPDWCSQSFRSSPLLCKAAKRVRRKSLSAIMVSASVQATMAMGSEQ